MRAVPFQSATELLAGLRCRDHSSTELLELYIERYERLNPGINAIVDTAFDSARDRARSADQARQKGESWGPLHGLPMTLKDTIEIKGMRSTFGSPLYAKHRSKRDADVTESLLEAGAIVFGKTNVPLWANDTHSYNEVYGQTNNPWDPSRSPGGSSGGACAALAAGLTGLEIGSDIGGSIRSPAHYCGVYGHKSSFGIVPHRGQAPPTDFNTHDYTVPLDLVVSGPLSRSADDLELVMDLIVRPEVSQRKAVKIELPPARHESLKDYRIGVWIDDPLYGPNREVGDRLQHTVDALAAAGAKIVDVRPDIDFARCVKVYRDLLLLSTVRTMAKGDFEGLVELSRKSDVDEASPIARYARSNVRMHREWLKLDAERAMLRSRWAEYFQQVDVMLCPSVRVPAFVHDHTTFGKRTTDFDGQALPHWDVVMPWAGLTIMAHLPATVAPVGCTPGGLPVGVQIVGPYMEDRTPIRLAQLMEEVTGGFTPPPGYD